MEYEITTLGEYARVQGGYAYKSADFQENGKCPVLKIKNVRFGYVDYQETVFIDESLAKSTSAWKTKEGDILISMTGSGPNAPNSLVGRAARVWKNDPDAWINQRVGRLVMKQKESIHPDILFYLLSLSSSQEYLVSNSSGSANQANINGKTIESLPCPKIDYRSSIFISKILREFDEKIAINQQINQTLEAMAQACFKSWFVDFEPTRAKMAALAAGGTEEDATLAAMSAISGQPHEALATLKTTNPESYTDLHTTASLFPSRLVDSDLGEIPEGWEVSEIGKEVVVVGGGTPSTKKPEFWDDGDIPWTTPKDLSNLNDKILIDTDRKITKQGLAKISSGLLPVNTVLMSSRAPVGYLALAKVPVAVNQGYIAMKCEKNLTPEYVLQWCAANMDDIKLRASGTTFAEISKSTFRPMTVLIPEAEVLQAYSRQVAAIYSQIETLVRENHALASMRDSLLPKLLSGEIIIEENHGGE